MSRYDRVFALAGSVIFMLMWPAAALAAAAGEGETNVGTDVTPFQNWQYIEGVVIPLIVAWLVKSRWRPSTQAIVMFFTCLVATALTMWFQGSLNDTSAANFAAKVTGLIALTITMYYGVWKPLGVTPQIKENVPSPIPG